MFGGVRRTTGSRANSEHSSRTGRVYFALTIVFTARRPQGAPLSALFTPPSKVSSPLSKRIPLHTLENDICPLFSPPLPPFQGLLTSLSYIHPFSVNVPLLCRSHVWNLSPDHIFKVRVTQLFAGHRTLSPLTDHLDRGGSMA